MKRRLVIALLPAVSVAVAASAAVGRDPCAAVVAHVPEAGVTYRPGVDVEGRAVAPADVPAPALDLPEEITFEITVPIRGGGRRHFTSRDYVGEALVGLLTLHADGRMSFNGRMLEPAGEAELRAACRRATRRP